MSQTRAIVLRKSFPYVVAVVTYNNRDTQFIEFRKEIQDLEYTKVLELSNAKGDHMSVSQMKKFLKLIK